MSDYTIAVAWSGKDNLADSDASKVISGNDFNTEFTTIRDSVNTKADRNGAATEDFAADSVTVAGTLAVTGVPTIPTANAGTNTTQAASTAFVTTAVAALDAAAINAVVYPVGSIYFNMTNANNPSHATLLGFGTWLAYGEGRVLVGKQSSGTFDALNEELGTETTTLDESQIPSHRHYQGSSAGQTATNNSIKWGQSAPGGDPNYSSPTGQDTQRFTSVTGGGAAHSNLQPSITVYMWKRTN